MAKITLWDDLDTSKSYVFGNWKMHKDIKATRKFFKGALKNYNPKVVAGIAVPFTDIHAAKKGADNIWAPKMWGKSIIGKMKNVQNIFIGAENVSFSEQEGAFTGEETVEMLKELKVDFVIIGHSERRTMNNETDKTVNEKAKILLKNKVVPIICCGENEQVFDKGETNKFIEGQIKAAFKDIDAKDAVHAIVAYEPMWAIGSGKTATPEIAEKVCAFIRKTLADIYSKSVANKIVIQYGGSVKPANAKDIMGQKDINGALIGGASLEPKSFKDLMNYNK